VPPQGGIFDALSGPGYLNCIYEIQVYDLYRTMADRETVADARDAFLSIAQMEKKHMRMLAKALSHC
jgi:rubrerythrin